MAVKFLLLIQILLCVEAIKITDPVLDFINKLKEDPADDAEPITSLADTPTLASQVAEKILLPSSPKTPSQPNFSFNIKLEEPPKPTTVKIMD